MNWPRDGVELLAWWAGTCLCVMLASIAAVVVRGAVYFVFH